MGLDLIKEDDIYLAKPKIKLVKTSEYVVVNFNESNLIVSQPAGLVIILSNGTNSVREVAVKLANLYDEDLSMVYKMVENIYKNYRNLFVKLPQKLCKYVNLVNDPNVFKFIPQRKEFVAFDSLLQVGLVLSEKCPLKCKYCYAFKKHHDVGFNFINFDLVKKFLKEASELGAKELNVGGGDPLMYPKIIDLIKFSYQIGFKEIYLSTKPSKYYEKDFFSTLFKAGLREIQFSLDAIDPLILRKIVKNKGFFGKIIYSIYNAILEAFKVIVKIVVLKDNISNVIPLVKFLYEIGVETINISVVMPIGLATLDMLPSDEQIELLEKKINKLPEKIRAKVTFSKGIFHNTNITFCSAYKTSCFLFPDGNIEPCDFMGSFRKEGNFSIGNIKKESLKELWFKEDEILKYFRRPPSIKECQNCDFRMMCLGGCKALSYLIFRDISYPFNYCEFGKGVLKKIFVVGSKNDW